MQLSSFAATRAVAALGLVLIAGAGCTSSQGDKAGQPPSAQATAAAEPVFSAAEPNAAEAALKKLSSGAVTGSGQLEESVANALAGQPSRAGRMEFLFICTGRSAVSISVRDGATQIPGASGPHQCGDGVFRRTLTVTTKSRLSFRADASPFTDEGEFAFAYVGEIR